MTQSSSEPRKTSCTTSRIPTDECAKSRISSGYSSTLLPPYLNNTEPLEVDDVPLQLALVTMELGSIRRKMAAMARQFEEMAKLVNPDLFMDVFGDG